MLEGEQIIREHQMVLEQQPDDENIDADLPDLTPLWENASGEDDDSEAFSQGYRPELLQTDDELAQEDYIYSRWLEGASSDHAKDDEDDATVHHTDRYSRASYHALWDNAYGDCLLPSS